MTIKFIFKKLLYIPHVGYTSMLSGNVYKIPRTTLL